MSRVLLPSDVRTATGWQRAGSRLVGALDRTGLPVVEVMSSRRLWGPLQTGRARTAPDRRVLGLSFDLDYQEDTDAIDRLLRCLDEAGARASFVAIGALVERDPDPYGRALAAGHELVNHTWTHPDNPVLHPDEEWWDLDVERMVEQVATAQDVFERELGVRPEGFRTPHFKDVHHMLVALERVPELQWLSTVLTTATPTGLPHHPARPRIAGDVSHRVSPRAPGHRSRLLQLPLTPCPDHRWSPLCSYHTIRRPHRSDVGQGFHDPAATSLLWRTALTARDGYVATYFDPKDVARDEPTARWFTGLLAEAVAAGWEVAPFGVLAEVWGPLTPGPARSTGG